VAKYLVYDNVLGSATARPIVAVFDCDDDEVADQTALLPANQTAALAPAGFIFDQPDRPEENGTATGGAATTLTDSTRNWTVDMFAAYNVTILSGTGSGQTRIIASNTATVLTVNVAWTTNPNATSVYQITESIVDYVYTWNTTTSAVNARVTANRYSLSQRQELMKRRRDDLKTLWLPNVTSYKKFGDTRAGEWLAYLSDLDAIETQGLWATAPERITWPTVPSNIEDDADRIFTRLYRRGNVLSTVTMGGGGNPTGGLMERGSNANGKYIRFADGTQICHETIASNFGSDVTWTFPAAFANASVFFHGMPTSADRVVTSGSTAISATDCTFRVFTLSTTPTIARSSVNTRLFAMGIWT